MEVSLRSRLVYRQARTTIIVAFVLGLLLSGIQIGMDLFKERERIDATITQILTTSRQPAAQAAYQLDGHLARNVVTGLIQYPALREVQLSDNFGTVLAEYSRPESEGPLKWLVSLLFGRDFHYQIILRHEASREPVGNLTIEGDGYILAWDFLQRAGLILIGGTIRDGSLALVLTLIFYYTITRPLLRISHRLSRINPAAPRDHLVEVPAGHQKDEMGLLARTVNGLLQGFHRSLDRSRAAEIELQEREVRLRSIMENVPDGIVTINERARVESVNSAAAGLFGAEADQLVGRSFTGLVLEPHRAELDRLLENYLQSHDPAVFENALREITIQGAEGSPLPVEVRFNEMRIHERRMVVCVVVDITDRIEAEKEIRKMEEQLLQSQKMEAVGTLASGIAHDFNNLLQAISGYTQLLFASKESGGQVRGLAGKIDNTVDRAAELVQRLLTFSRKVKPQLKRIELNDEVRQAVGMLERIIPKMIGIALDLAPDLRPIAGDPYQIEQVVMNLGVNARDAMPDGGTLTIETRNVQLGDGESRMHPGLAPGPYVLLRMSDTGQGMDRETAAHVFEPFFTTKGVGQGTGLGLSMVYGIVGDHGGRIVCNSTDGRGTSFDVLFPVLTDGTVRHPGRAESPVGDLHGKESILIVDDETSIVDVARELLEQYGYEIATAASGEEALERYAARPPDLVVMDLGMPGMGGLRCLTEILALDASAKVLIASGYQSDEWRKAAEEAGAAGFIGKPYRLAKLLAEVRRLLDETGAA